MSKLYDLSDFPKFDLKIANYPFLFSIKESINNVGGVICIDDYYYSIVAYDIEGNVGVRKVNPPKIDEPDDLFSEDNIICPYCGHEEQDSWEFSDDDDNFECNQCGAIFAYNRHVSVTYCMDPVKPPEIKTLTRKD